MKISSQNSSISFEKSLVAKAGFVRAGKTRTCKIFRLFKDVDNDYFYQIRNRDKWLDSSFMEEVSDNIKNLNDHKRVYVLEDKKENCLGLVELVDLPSHNKKEVLFLETCPKYSNSNSDRKAKYIGETLMAFVTKLAKKDKNDKVSISVYTQNAFPFYVDKCKFSQASKTSKSIELPKSKFGHLLFQNGLHTKRRIELISSSQ